VFNRHGVNQRSRVRGGSLVTLSILLVMRLDELSSPFRPATQGCPTTPWWSFFNSGWSPRSATSCYPLSATATASTSILKP
jgi:hypothetical protein